MKETKFALVSEGAHEHLYVKHANDEAYHNIACLGNVPAGMYCAWSIGATNFVQRKFRSKDSARNYIISKLSEEMAYDLDLDEECYYENEE